MTVRWVIAVLAIGLLILTGAPAEAGSLANLIPNLFGPDGIILAPPRAGAPGHEAHSRVGSRGELTTLDDASAGSSGPSSCPPRRAASRSRLESPGRLDLCLVWCPLDRDSPDGCPHNAQQRRSG